MKINRRNALIGIGAAAAGSGAVLGSGALTSVSASRDIAITTVDDSGAYVQLSADSPLVGTRTDGNNGRTILDIDLDQLNDEATTTLKPAFTITNQVGEGVGVRITSVPSGVTLVTNTNGDDITAWPSASGDDHNLASNGDSVSVDLTVDTSTATDTSATLTIEADTSQDL